MKLRKNGQPDKRSITSAQNGRKYGGRPISSETLKTQLQRKMLITWLEPQLNKIFTALAEKAKKGDVPAAKELLDRAWGKAEQPMWHGDHEGSSVVFMPTQIINKHVIATGIDSGTDTDSQ